MNNDHWTESAVVMEVNENVVMAIVGEEIEPTKFLMDEFPEELIRFIEPGFSFEWICRKGVFSITLPGDDPAG